MIDIEDREQAEKEFRKLVDVLPQYMCVYSADGSPLYANDSLLDFFGFTLDDFRADDFQTRAFHPEDVERVRSDEIMPCPAAKVGKSNRESSERMASFAGF